MLRLLWGFLIVTSVVAPQGRACLCFSMPMCSQPPDPGERRTIFSGVVIEMYPGSSDVYRSVESALSRTDAASLRRAKAIILRLWKPVLSPAEVRRIEVATSRDEVRALSPMGPFARRIRFQVTEWLQGNPGGEAEIFTEATSCGYRFKKGEQYLVVSRQDKMTNRWWTWACSRTAPLDSADAIEDLKALRAWRDGRTLAPRVYGEIYDQREGNDPRSPAPSGVSIRLTGPSSEQEIRVGAEGRFSFDNLAPASHRLEVVAGPVIGSPQEIDLSHGGCFEAEVVLGSDLQYSILGFGAPRWDWASGIFATPPPTLPAPMMIPPTFLATHSLLRRLPIP